MLLYTLHTYELFHKQSDEDDLLIKWYIKVSRSGIEENQQILICLIYNTNKHPEIMHP